MSPRFETMRVVTLAASIATLAACGIESNPLWLVMSVDKNVVAIDDSVRVSLTVTNTGDRSVTTDAESTYGPCLPGFEVLDEDGHPAEMFVVCSASLPPMVALEPGESFQVTTWWKPGITRVGATPIGPGRYTIRGVVRSDNATVRSGSFGMVVTE